MGLIEQAKEIADFVQKLGNIDLYRKIVELEGDIIELIREKRLLEDKNQELERQLEMKGKLIFRKPVYYIEGDDTPYCARCWEAEGQTIHLTKIGKPTDPSFQCYKCKIVYSNVIK